MPTITACRNVWRLLITYWPRSTWSGFFWAVTNSFISEFGTENQLSDYIKEMLLDPRTRNRLYLNGKALEAMVEGHLRGNRNYTTEIHKILSCELLHRQLID